MLGEERLGEPDEVRDRPVAAVRPTGREHIRVARSLRRPLALSLLIQVRGADGVGVVLRQRAVGDDEELHVLKQARPRPERVTLVAPDLVERLANVHAASLEFNVHERQPVNQDRHVVTIGTLDRPTAAGRRHTGDLVLVDDLQTVVVDVDLVDERDVLRRPVLTPERLDMILLDADRLLPHRVIRRSDHRGEEPLPLPVGELDAVQRLKLCAQVREQVLLRSDRQVLIRLLPQQPDKLRLQLRLRLIPRRLCRVGLELRDNRRLRRQRDRLEPRSPTGGRHRLPPA